MKEYIITYKIGDGTKKKIIYDANSKSEAKNLAIEDGFNVLSINENITFSGVDKFLEKNFPSMVKLKSKTILAFFTQLLFLVEADINLINAVESMKKGARDKKYRRFLRETYNGILEGKQLSDMLVPQYGFDPEVQMQIKSGEKSGNIASSIKAIVERMTREGGTKSMVLKQLSYPIIVVIIMIGVVYYILTNVIPGLTEILVETGGELPKITIFLINASEFAQVNGLKIIGTLAFFVFLLIYFKKKEYTGYYIDKVFLKIPVFGEVIKLSSLSRYFYIASNMLSGDIPLVTALEVASKAIPNKYMKKRLGSFYTEIKKQGTPLDILMSNFNPTSEYADLVNTGLSTGRIEEIFEKISQDTLKASDTKVKSITAMIEPVITIFLGGVIALIVFSLFMPMFKVMDAI